VRLVLQIFYAGSIAAQPTAGQRGAAERGEEHKSAAEVDLCATTPAYNATTAPLRCGASPIHGHVCDLLGSTARCASSILRACEHHCSLSHCCTNLEHNGGFVVEYIGDELRQGGAHD
jgi:hypothetical protein